MKQTKLNFNNNFQTFYKEKCLFIQNIDINKLCTYKEIENLHKFLKIYTIHQIYLNKKHSKKK